MGQQQLPVDLYGDWINFVVKNFPRDGDPEVMQQLLEVWAFKPEAFREQFKRMIFSLHEGFPVWKKITIGTVPSAEDLLEQVKEQGCIVDQEVEELVRSQKLEMCSEEHETHLILLPVADLGFSRNSNVRQDELLKKAHEKGLRQCTHEVALQLCAQYPNERYEEPIYIAARAFYNRRQEQRSFVLTGSQPVRITTFPWNYSRFLNPVEKVVFEQRRRRLTA